MTSKKAIKQMMAVGIPRDTARLWSDIGTCLCMTNEAITTAAIHCEGKRPIEIWDTDVVCVEQNKQRGIVRKSAYIV